jgi:phospholipid transport system substrate-binding protein
LREGHSRRPARAGLLAALLLLPGLAAGEAEAPADPSTRVVERLHGALLGVMQEAEKLGYQGRHDRLAPVVSELFDLPFMAEKSVGRYWGEAGSEDRQRLVAVFTRYIVANYANRFDGWGGQQFETLGSEPSARGTVLVRTRLLDPAGENVALDYRLRDAGGQWRIIDIYLDGKVSELALRRSEYSSLIKREGFEALLAALDQRISELAAAPQAGAS